MKFWFHFICGKTYTAIEVRLWRKRSWTFPGTPEAPSSRHVSTRMSGMACGTHSDLERSRFGGQKPTADGLSALVDVCDRLRSRNQIDDNFIFVNFNSIAQKMWPPVDHLDTNTHTHTHTTKLLLLFEKKKEAQTEISCNDNSNGSALLSWATLSRRTLRRD